ncbi:hypothetical protein LIA77_07170 [Sarocladium implicatum]|nr:hypothetical protein LIA77_07170 [Sarocladium implicatum]
MHARERAVPSCACLQHRGSIIHPRRLGRSPARQARRTDDVVAATGLSTLTSPPPRMGGVANHRSSPVSLRMTPRHTALSLPCLTDARI